MSLAAAIPVKKYIQGDLCAFRNKHTEDELFVFLTF